MSGNIVKLATVRRKRRREELRAKHQEEAEFRENPIEGILFNVQTARAGIAASSRILAEAEMALAVVLNRLGIKPKT